MKPEISGQIYNPHTYNIIIHTGSRTDQNVQNKDYLHRHPDFGADLFPVFCFFLYADFVPSLWEINQFYMGSVRTQILGVYF